MLVKAIDDKKNIVVSEQEITATDYDNIVFVKGQNTTITSKDELELVQFMKPNGEWETLYKKDED